MLVSSSHQFVVDKNIHSAETWEIERFFSLGSPKLCICLCLYVSTFLFNMYMFVCICVSAYICMYLFMSMSPNVCLHVLVVRGLGATHLQVPAWHQWSVGEEDPDHRLVSRLEPHYHVLGRCKLHSIELMHIHTINPHVYPYKPLSLGQYELLRPCCITFFYI